MSNELTASQERELKKGINERLALLRKRGSNRRLGHLADSENPNRQIQKSDAEQAIAGLHRRHDSGRTIAKRAEPTLDAGALAISKMHQHPGEFADRPVSGNTDLVTKLANALVRAVAKDYASAREAKATIRKLIETGSSAGQPRNHSTLKSGKGKIGTVTIVKKRGADYPYEIQADGYFHSCYQDVAEAEQCFAALTA